jgi:hypothetical protein
MIFIGNACGTLVRGLPEVWTCTGKVETLNVLTHTFPYVFFANWYKWGIWFTLYNFFKTIVLCIWKRKMNVLFSWMWLTFIKGFTHFLKGTQLPISNSVRDNIMTRFRKLEFVLYFSTFSHRFIMKIKKKKPRKKKKEDRPITFGYFYILGIRRQLMEVSTEPSCFLFCTVN